MASGPIPPSQLPSEDTMGSLVQTRYLILAALATGLAILAAAAVWFSGI